MSIIVESVVCGLSGLDVAAIREGRWLVPIYRDTGYVIGFRQEWDYPAEQFTTFTVPANATDQKNFERHVDKICRVILFEEDLQQLESGMPIMTPEILLFFHYDDGSELLQ